jgi:hypothetical protein
MIDNDKVDAFNSRPKADLNSIKKMTPAQLDKIKTYGTQAENLLQNRDFVLFIHHFKFDVADALGAITSHTEEDNYRRIALSNQLAGIDAFVATLQRAKYYKDRVVTQQHGAAEPDSI